MREITLEELMSIIDSGRNFQVLDYSQGSILIDDVRGIVRLSEGEVKEELSVIKKRGLRGKPTKEQIEVTKRVVMKLVENGIKFKVVFGPKEVTIRFDLDHYIRLTDEDVRVVGFKDKSEGVLGTIAHILEEYGRLRILRRMS